MDPSVRDGPSHPLCLLSLTVLVLNDHVLKHAIPGVVTGKLSDVAWLILAPVVLAALLVRVGVPGRAARPVALIGAVVPFVVLQLWPPLGELWGRISGGHHVADVADLVTLPAVWLAPLCWRPTRRRAWALPVATLGLLATD